MGKLFKIYNWLKDTQLLKYVLGFVALILPLLKWFESFIKHRQNINIINSSDRPEDIGEVDKHGYKQLPASGGSSSDVIPSDITAKEKIQVKIEGTISNDNENEIEETQDIIDELKKYGEQ